MKKDLTNILTIAILAVFFVVMAIALAACQSDAPQPTQAQPEATAVPTQAQPEATAPPESTQPEATIPPAGASTIDGAALLDERCSVCHSPDKAKNQTNTSEGWAAIVTEMVGKGAELTAEEQAVLVEYLAQNYGK